jgi:hypothetical protein
MIPNSGKIIASGDIQEINRLLQFILGCAVNSQRKDHFVKEILKMEETVQVSKITTLRMTSSMFNKYLVSTINMYLVCLGGPHESNSRDTSGRRKV